MSTTWATFILLPGSPCKGLKDFKHFPKNSSHGDPWCYHVLSLTGKQPAIADGRGHANLADADHQTQMTKGEGLMNQLSGLPVLTQPRPKASRYFYPITAKLGCESCEPVRQSPSSGNSGLPASSKVFSTSNQRHVPTPKNRGYCGRAILPTIPTPSPHTVDGKSCTTLDAQNPMNKRINHPSTGAKNLPSTVPPGKLT